MYRVVLTLARMKGAALGVLLRAGVLILILAPLISQGTGSVSLAWNASTNSGIAGYNIYYGNASHNYGNVVFAGTNLAMVVSGLPTGQTYYFAVTAVDSLGNESDFSNEISDSIAAVNQPPTISAIAAQSTYTGQPVTVSFTINDPDTGPNGLLLSAVSSNSGLVPSGNISFGGTGGNRTVTITPLAGQTGSAQISITVSDGSLTAQSSFTLTVADPPPDQPPTISAIAAQTTYTGRPISVSFTINDPDTALNSLSLSAFSSNSGLVPSGNMSFGGSGANRTLTITPAGGQTGSAQLSITVSDGILTAQTSFTLNVVQPVAMQTSDVGKSTVNGLFYESSVVRVPSAGALKLTVSTGGKYSGQILMAAGKYSFSGQFGTLCEATNVVARKGATPLSVYFVLKSAGTTPQLTGTVSDGTWTAQAFGEASAFSLKTNPAPYAGSYTLEIPGQQNSSLSVGNSYAALKVDGNGNVKMAGALADGSKISASAPLGPDGMWPLFVPLYKGQGLLIGWISFTNRLGDDLHGPVNWIKLPSAGGVVYPQGLTYESSALGSAFSSTGAQPLIFGSAQLEVGSTSDALLMSLKVSPRTGVFTANMLNRVTGKPVKFQGALLQKLNAGYGFLVVTNQSAPVVITP